jgi:hypothetical protein
MLVALSVRRLKPGHYDDFRRAWEPDEFPPPLTKAYHARRLDNPDEVISFGLLDVDHADIERVRATIAETAEDGRQSAMAEHVEELLVDAVYEVVEEVVPAGRT